MNNQGNSIYVLFNAIGIATAYGMRLSCRGSS